MTENNKAHPRFLEFKGTDSNGAGFLLGAVLFQDETKLRSHAVKHFSCIAEVGDWQKLKKFQSDRVTACIDSLREIGCPHLAARTINPPCQAGGRKCRLFEACGSFVDYLEETFLELCRLVIQHSLNVPRDVQYRGTDQGEYWWLLPEVPVVAKLAAIDGGRYNLMTCYRPLAEIRAPWRQILKHIVKTVRMQSKGMPQWNTEETWGLGMPPDGTDGNQGGGDDQGKQRTRKRNKPYRREKSDWRHHLDRYDI